MLNNRVLFIRSNPVNPDSRVEKETSALADVGYSVNVLCWDRDSNHKPEKNVLKDGRVSVVRLGYKASFGEGFKNIIPYLKFQFGMRKWLRRNKKDFDFVHACDFDTAYFSYKLAKRLKKTFVFDIFDFICGEGRTLLQRVVKKMQFKIINKSDAVIICTEDRLNQIKGTNPKKLIVVHNTPPLMVSDSKKDETLSNGVINVVYVGILSNNRLLLEESKVFARHPDWHFYVGGFGLHEQFFVSESKKHSNINFVGKIPYNQTIELESKADVLLAIYDPEIENHKYAAPNKFYESLMLGKPLLMVKGTGMSNVVKDNDIGVLIDYSEEGFENGVNEIISRKQEWVNMSKKAKELYLNQYNWETMANRLTNLYKELSGIKK